MAYATQDDLLQRMTLAQLTQLTDDATPKAGVPDETKVNGALEEASGRVDSYCRSRYVTPLQQSDTVTTITRDVAVYFLFSRRPQQMAETVRQRYEDAMAMLKDVAAGKAVLDQPVTAAAPQSVSAEAVKPTHDHRRFTEKDIHGFV
jgi:phage gp36-like protein